MSKKSLTQNSSPKRIEYFRWLDIPEDVNRLRIKLDRAREEITYLVVQYETLIEEKWLAIVRYDTAHGYFHKDTLGPKGLISKESIPVTDFNEAVEYAIKDLQENWEYYRQKFIRLNAEGK